MNNILRPVELIKPLVDDREYRYIELPNGLCALLVNDPTTDKAAAALDVGVGAFSDPLELPGLAHFLEHLLFMGTKKFPAENEYSVYISEHGGMSNAFTGSEHTNFHFEVSWEHLEGSLDRFAQFFIEPLFLESCQQREIMAVDSENKKNLQNDIWRFYQLEKHLSNPNHPINKFSTGNLDTLMKRPAVDGINVRERLLQFYAAHYTAAIMKLVVISRHSLDTLEEWTRKYFTSVPNTHPSLALKKPDYLSELPLRKGIELGKLISVEPVMDVKTLEISFMVPDQQPLYSKQPYHYYVHLLGHESKGSVLYYLKQKRWATELGCAISHICVGTDYLLVNIELTNEGMLHWKEVAGVVFAYVEMVKKAGPQQFIFDEIMRTTKASFLYRQKGKAMPLSSSLAQAMHRPIPPEHLLDYSVATEYDSELIAKFGEYLTKDNSRVMLASKQLAPLPKTEPWYGTKYDFGDLPDITVPDLGDQLHLPHPNEFLPTDFQLVSEGNTVELPKVPTCVLSTPHFRVWHKLDDTFRIPKAHIFLKLVNTNVNSTFAKFRAAKNFCAMITDLLSDHAYYADVAGVSFTLGALHDGFEIEVHGFSQKLFNLLKTVVECVVNGELLEERFEVLKEQQLRTLRNLLLSEPYRQLALHSNFLLVEHVNSVEDRVRLLENLTFADVLALSKELKHQGFGLEMLAVGNITSQDAVAAASELREILPKPAENDEQTLVDHKHDASYVYDPGMQYYYKRTLSDPNNVNNGYFSAYSFGEENSIALSALASLASQVLKEATFNQLRTKEQLGYIVGSYKKVLPSSNLFVVYAQSSFPTTELEASVERYLTTIAGPMIANMPASEFAQHVEATIAHLTEKFKNLNDEADSHWRACNEGTYDFVRNFRIADAVREITQPQLLAAFTEFVLNPASRRRFALHLSAAKMAPIDMQIALARAVGELVTERNVQVTPQQIEQFIGECRGLSPEQAMKVLATKLCTDAHLTPEQAQSFVGDAVQRSREIALGTQTTEKRPIGVEITDLQKYYSSVRVGPQKGAALQDNN